MKKTATGKKLKLSTETIRKLTTTDLKEVVGGRTATTTVITFSVPAVSC